MASFSLVPGGRGTNYTGMLTRSIIFSIALFIFLAGTGLTIASIIIPNWISYETTTDSGRTLHYNYGLHRRCQNTDVPPSTSLSLATSALHCTEFPRYEECEGKARYFCSMWRSVGFLMSFAVVIEGMTIAAFAILLAGGKQRREAGWATLAILTAVAAFVQAIGLALIAYLYENDDRFFAGWFLDKSWSMSTTSAVFEIFCAAAITAAALVLPSEGGYELIPDQA
ncbi:hypothetical protein DV736_g5090, partial [Chaetothyriales sp. CBS 134916]